MTTDDVRPAVLAALHRAVPEVDVEALRPDLDLRSQVDMDSIDFLRFLVAVHDATGVDIPESAYGTVRTLEGLVTYLSVQRAAAAPPVSAS